MSITKLGKYYPYPCCMDEYRLYLRKPYVLYNRFSTGLIRCSERVNININNTPMLIICVLYYFIHLYIFSINPYYSNFNRKFLKLFIYTYTENPTKI